MRRPGGELEDVLVHLHHLSQTTDRIESVESTGKTGKAYMGIEYLHLAQDRMQEDQGCCSLADKPVAGSDVDWGTIQRVRVHRSRQYRKASKDRKPCTQSTSNMRPH